MVNIIELIHDVASIDLVFGNNIYLTMIDTYVSDEVTESTKTLIKSNYDGTNRRYICSGFSRIISINPNYVYYVDTMNNLHVVTVNGLDDRILISNFEKELIVNNEKVFFFAKEYVGEYCGENDKFEGGHSIYSIDLNGHNLKKIAFNVKHAEMYDENTIYYNSDEVITFNIQDLVGDKPKGKPRSKRYLINTFYALNASDLVLTRLYYSNFPKLNVKKPGDKPSKKAKKVEITYAKHYADRPEKEVISFSDRMLEKQKEESLFKNSKNRRQA